jgi:hypothetical protein
VNKVKDREDDGDSGSERLPSNAFEWQAPAEVEENDERWEEQWHTSFCNLAEEINRHGFNVLLLVGWTDPLTGNDTTFRSQRGSQNFIRGMLVDYASCRDDG